MLIESFKEIDVKTAPQKREDRFSHDYYSLTSTELQSLIAALRDFESFDKIDVGIKSTVEDNVWFTQIVIHAEKTKEINTGMEILPLESGPK